MLPWLRKEFFNVLNLVLAGLALWVGNASFDEARKATKAAENAVAEAHTQAQAALDQKTLEFPPLLRVNNFVIWEHGKSEAEAPTLFREGTAVEGFAFVINPGREDAFIEKAFCDFYWLKKPLPMYRPYLPRKAIFPSLSNGDPVDKLGPGQFASWKLKTTVPKRKGKGEELYALGYVVYQDRLGTHRSIYFAKRYDERERRFVETNDPYYVVEE